VYWEDICGISSIAENAGKLVPLSYRVAEAEAEQNAIASKRRQCQVCSGSDGMLVRCGAEACGTLMHVSCAQRNGNSFQLTGHPSAAANDRAGRELAVAAALSGVAGAASLIS
jgi:hypothetical protein